MLPTSPVARSWKDSDLPARRADPFSGPVPSGPSRLLGSRFPDRRFPIPGDPLRPLGTGLATHHRAPFTVASPLAAAGCLPRVLAGTAPLPVAAVGQPFARES
jgi:hypothetical protein